MRPTIGDLDPADGEPFVVGEAYALVWTPTGSEFQGIGMDGVAMGDSKPVIRVPFAKDGHCPNVQFEIETEYAAKNYPNGTCGVYLLDTRTVDDGSMKVVVNGRKGQVFGCVAVVSDVKSSVSSVKSTEVEIGTVEYVVPPKIERVELLDEMVYLFQRYSVPSPSMPTDPGGVKDVITIRPMQGAQGFFSVNRK